MNDDTTLTLIMIQLETLSSSCFSIIFFQKSTRRLAYLHQKWYMNSKVYFTLFARTTNPNSSQIQIFKPSQTFKSSKNSKMIEMKFLESISYPKPILFFLNNFTFSVFLFFIDLKRNPGIIKKVENHTWPTTKFWWCSKHF